MHESIVPDAPIAISDYEIERGKPMPSRNHALIQGRLTVLLDTYSDDFTIFPEVDLDFKPKGATPDLCIYPKMHIDFSEEDEIKMKEPPITAIEILSPKQALEEVILKARKIYFANQVQSVWVVLPSLRSIALLQDAKSDPQFFTSADTLSDPATGIQINVGEVFRG